MRHLVIAAFWTDTEPDDSVRIVADVMDEIAIKGSGAVVSVKGVDLSLRRWLRQVQLEEAADFRVAAQQTGEPR